MQRRFSAAWAEEKRREEDFPCKTYVRRRGQHPPRPHLHHLLLLLLHHHTSPTGDVRTGRGSLIKNLWTRMRKGKRKREKERVSEREREME